VRAGVNSVSCLHQHGQPEKMRREVVFKAFRATNSRKSLLETVVLHPRTHLEDCNQTKGSEK